MHARIVPMVSLKPAPVDIPRAASRKPRRRTLFIGLGLAAVALVTVALSNLKPAAPAVDRAGVWLDTVRLGPLVRQVRGPGTLVPEQIRWISALTAGRVERIWVEPGARIADSTLLLELSNPDVQLEALEAQRQLTAAEATLIQLRAGLDNEALAQRSALATLRAEVGTARRQSESNEALASGKLISEVELTASRERMTELVARLDLAEQRLRVLTSSAAPQIASQSEQIDRLRRIVRFHEAQVQGMKVRAGDSGVLQALPLEVGQWVTSGATLARVAKPERLKAVLQIPETQAKDVELGQHVTIDTRNGVVSGEVARINPAVQNGTVSIDVRLTGALPAGARPDQSIDGTVEIERLANVLHVGRPAVGIGAGGTVSLFKVEPDGEAARVAVQLGRASVDAVEVRQGLAPGDVIILSDLSAWDGHDRIQLK